MLAQEAGDWQTVVATNLALHLPDSFVAECHWKAMQWAREMVSGA